jgi:SAM-dependent methyltransferase
MPYYLPEDYTPRLDNEAFDDTPHTDLWQNDVYELAHQLAVAYGLGTILDIGCGSGFKLMKFFEQFHTAGVEVEPTLSWLKERYPDRLWLPPGETLLTYKLVICSDVIEHVADPDALLESIKKVRPTKIVISTPERSMLACDQAGPPNNLAHQREWNFTEFDRYLTDHFHVVSHYVINEDQCTQVAVCELRP